MTGSGIFPPPRGSYLWHGTSVSSAPASASRADVVLMAMTIFLDPHAGRVHNPQATLKTTTDNLTDGTGAYFHSHTWLAQWHTMASRGKGASPPCNSFWWWLAIYSPSEWLICARRQQLRLVCRMIGCTAERHPSLGGVGILSSN